MSQITLDKETANRFQNTSEIVQVCDPTGKVIGEFIPIATSDDWEPTTPDLSDDELRRREQETESYTTAQVLAHLEQIQ